MLPNPIRGPRGVPLLLAACGVLAACDVPTALPRWETRWLIPLDSARIAVASLLPSGVRLAAGGAAFELDVPSVTVRRTLRQMCGSPCVAAAGQVVPKPAFTTSFSTSTPLPPDVASAQLVGGRLIVELSHTLGFDPIRPGGAARGYVLMVAESGGRVVARDSVPGEAFAFPAGSVLRRTANIAAGAVTSPIRVALTVHSPAGDPVRIDPDQAFRLEVAAQQVRVSRAEVSVAGRAVTTAPVELDLEEVDAAIIEQVREGALVVELTNPFDVAGPLVVTIAWPAGTVRRTVQLAPGTAEHRIPLTGDELRSFLGQPSVRVTVAGTVSAPSGTATVRPGDAVVIRAQLELALGPEEG